MIQTSREKNRYDSPLSELIELCMEDVLVNDSDTRPINTDPGDDEEIPF